MAASLGFCGGDEQLCSSLDGLRATLSISCVAWMDGALDMGVNGSCLTSASRLPPSDSSIRLPWRSWYKETPLSLFTVLKLSPPVLGILLL